MCDGTAWTFVAPRADLVGDNGQLIVKHFAGPTWQATDGSSVKGTVLQRATVADKDGNPAIPWLLLQATDPKTGDGGGDRLTHTTFIQQGRLLLLEGDRRRLIGRIDLPNGHSQIVRGHACCARADRVGRSVFGAGRRGYGRPRGYDDSRRTIRGAGYGVVGRHGRASSHTPGREKCSAAWFGPSHQQKWGCAASWAPGWGDLPPPSR